MHKKCIAIVGIVRIVSDFWHNSGKLSDNSELREWHENSKNDTYAHRGGKVRKLKFRRMYIPAGGAVFGKNFKKF